MKSKNRLLVGGLMCLSAAMAAPRVKAADYPTWTVLTSYSYPTLDHIDGSAGMTYDGEHILFLAQRAYWEYIYFLDPLTGAVENKIIPVNQVTLSMAWDGQYIRAADGSAPYGRVYSVDPVTGADVSFFPFPEGTRTWVEGLAYDGHSLFLASTDRGHDRLVAEVDPATGEVRNSYVTPNDLYGLTWGGGDIMYGAAMKDRKIIAFDKNTGQTLYSIQSPGAGWCQAVAFDGEHLFVADPETSTIFVLVPEPASLSLLALGGLAMLRRRRRR